MAIRCAYKHLLNTSPRPRWYFSVAENVWNNYDWKDSDHIETDYFNKLNTSLLQNNKVINFRDMTETVNGDTSSTRKVLRGSWFFKGDDDVGTMVPYTADISEILEKEFLKGNFQKKEITHKPPRDVIMYADISFKQYRRTKHADPEGRAVERGFNRILLHIFPGYPLPPHTQVFGADLNILMTHPMNINHKIPVIVEHCLSILNVRISDPSKYGNELEGIFRICASVNEIDEIKRTWDCGEVVDLSKNDIHDVAGVLKSFIRDLPDPIFKGHLIKLWLNIGQTGDILQEIRSLLTQLPQVNFKILVELFRLFRNVASIEALKMTPSNLAICWAPTLFFSTDVRELDQFSKLISLMVENRDNLFKE